MESENNKEFDRHIKAKLDELEPEVPASLWNAIAKELPAEQNLRSISDKRGFSYSWAAIAACLLIAFSFWKFQPEEVIHLRSTTASADRETPGDRVVIQVHPPAEPVQKSGSDAPATPARRQVTPPAGPGHPDRLSDISPNTYASVNKVNIEPHQPVKALKLPEHDFIDDPEVQSVLEEEVAFAPVPLEEAGAVDVPATDAEAFAVEDKSRPKVVSSVLNFIASNIQIGSGATRVEFSETEHGVLKVDIKGFLNKNNQGL